MSRDSGIEWCDATWNPVTGCSDASIGCRHCYARRMALRLQAMGQRRYADGFKVREHPEALEEPWLISRRRQPLRIFTCSMGDLFHPEVSEDFVQHVFRTMDPTCERDTFLVLTKRPWRAAVLATKLTWPANLWMGTTLEGQEYLGRIEGLLRTPARIHFLSLEPLLGPIEHLSLQGIDWVIVGGETGPGARPMEPAWPRSIRDQCVAAGVPFFFKRWGPNARSSRLLDGRTWEEMPT